MKLIKLPLIWIVCLTLFSTTLFSTLSYALDLSQAKQQGRVGEQLNGYLGSPQGNKNNEVAALIKDINARRKQKYQEIAVKVGKPLATVEQLAGDKAIKKTLPGHYIQSAGGAWVKK